jgi:hypothetical protein
VRNVAALLALLALLALSACEPVQFTFAALPDDDTCVPTHEILGDDEDSDCDGGNDTLTWHDPSLSFTTFRGIKAHVNAEHVLLSTTARTFTDERDNTTVESGTTFYFDRDAPDEPNWVTWRQDGEVIGSGFDATRIDNDQLVVALDRMNKDVEAVEIRRLRWSEAGTYELSETLEISTNVAGDQTSLDLLWDGGTRVSVLHVERTGLTWADVRTDRVAPTVETEASKDGIFGQTGWLESTNEAATCGEGDPPPCSTWDLAGTVTKATSTPDGTTRAQTEDAVQVQTLYDGGARVVTSSSDLVLYDDMTLVSAHADAATGDPVVGVPDTADGVQLGGYFLPSDDPIVDAVVTRWDDWVMVALVTGSMEEASLRWAFFHLD